ncbi:ORC6 [Mytilus edulis]|uniref:ORC6 n=1 Tax=Mytilus edulis TaxID=6550 RepID=A0A8S3SAI5_MYTED|nr:ORC6 [Mytilus edulis]
MSKNAIRSVAQNLGVTSQSIIRKAEELLQLVDIRVGSQSLTALNLTGSCCVVMCIDLAATGSGQPVNKGEALRLSGVNKRFIEMVLRLLKGTRKLCKKKKNTIVDDIERLSQDEVSTPKKQKEEEEQNIKTDYEQWKKQILENARIAIKDGK